MFFIGYSFPNNLLKFESVCIDGRWVPDPDLLSCVFIGCRKPLLPLGLKVVKIIQPDGSKASLNNSHYATG